MNKQNVNCPLCGSTNKSTVYKPWIINENHMELYSSAIGKLGTQYVVMCTECTMMYESPRYGKAEIERCYSHAISTSHDTQYTNRVNNFCKILQNLQISNLIPHKDLRVLDVGTASGAFLEACQKNNYTCEGVEPSTQLVELAKKRNLPVSVGTIMNKNISEKYDMICFWDVLEHICEPREALHQSYKLLNENGVLIINIPDHGNLLSKIFGKRYWWIMSVHLNFFTKKTIEKMCSAEGYRVYKIKKYWQTLSIDYLLSVAIDLKIPLARLLKILLPLFIKKKLVYYYAGQMTVIAKKTSEKN